MSRREQVNDICPASSLPLCCKTELCDAGGCDQLGCASRGPPQRFEPEAKVRDESTEAREQRGRETELARIDIGDNAAASLAHACRAAHNLKLLGDLRPAALLCPGCLSDGKNRKPSACTVLCLLGIKC